MEAEGIERNPRYISIGRARPTIICNIANDLKSACDRCGHQEHCA